MNLNSLSEQADYRVRGDDTDPRGWQITDVNGVTIGTVTDLIIDLDALVARYIVCTLTGRAERTVLLPVGFARFEDGIVHLDFITTSVIDQLPTFTSLPLSEEQEARSAKALTGITPTTTSHSQIIRRVTDRRPSS